MAKLKHREPNEMAQVHTALAERDSNPASLNYMALPLGAPKSRWEGADGSQTEGFQAIRICASLGKLLIFSFSLSFSSMKQTQWYPLQSVVMEIK